MPHWKSIGLRVPPVAPAGGVSAIDATRSGLAIGTFPASTTVMTRWFGPTPNSSFTTIGRIPPDGTAPTTSRLAEGEELWHAASARHAVARMASPVERRRMGHSLAAPVAAGRISARIHPRLPGGLLTRFQRLAAATVATVFLLVTLGVLVRVTNSGVACPHWPGCFQGQFLPSLSADYHVWLEWLHRTVAAIIGFEALSLAYLAFRDHRSTPSILWPSFAAVALVGFQAWLGQETVRLGNSGPSVTAHLAAAMAVVGLLVYLLVRASYPTRFSGPSESQRFTLLAAFGAAATFVVLLFGSNVTATDAALVFTDWPLMNGSLLPAIPADAGVASMYAAHILHRYVAALVLVILVGVWWYARRSQREHPRLVSLAGLVVAAFAVQAVVGGLQVLTTLAPWTLTLHVALGAAVWALATALAVAAYYEARTVGIGATVGSDGTGDRGSGAGTDGDAVERPAASLGDTLRAYVALTKPRIIELLLVTTVPAMVLASREVPGMPVLDWLRLTAWTLVCGTLAAGAANAINQYLERDIDGLMNRTRRRPLPASQVKPEHAVAFGIVLGAISVGLMAWAVNLVAALLTLLAIGFYVVVYTILLKRSTPQNIVIGGAAGALPPGLRWGAGTGRGGIPAGVPF